MNGNSPTAYILVNPEADSSGAAKHLSEFIARNGAEWWHWLKDTWIIYDPRARTPLWWRDQLLGYWAPHPIQFLFFQIVLGGTGWGARLSNPALVWLQQRFGGTIETPPALPAPAAKPGR